MKQDDLLWKAVLEDVFDDFLLFIFKEKTALLDLEKGFDFLDKELDQLFPENTTEAGRLRFVDKLVKVFTTDGEEKWILVHIEVQGYRDDDFAKRMFTYFYRIYDKYNKLVTSIAIFTGGNRNHMPNEFRYEFMGVENIFRYNVFRIIDADAEALTNNSNPFALVVLTALAALEKARNFDETLLPLKIEIFKALVKSKLPKKKVRGIMNFLQHYVHFENPENSAKFEEAISVITGKNNVNMGTEEYLLQKAEKKGEEKGIEKGMEKGIQVGMLAGEEKSKIAFVKTLLTSTDFDDEKIASFANASLALVKEIKMQLTSLK